MEDRNIFHKWNLQQQKIMVIVWVSGIDVIRYISLESNQNTIAVYCQHLHEMHIGLRKMRPALVNRHNFYFMKIPGHMWLEWHCKSSPSWHTRFFVYSSYSLHLSPTDFYLRNFWARRHFVAKKESEKKKSEKKKSEKRN